MTLKIIKEKENPLFSRKEISFEIYSEIVPNHKDILDKISKKLSVSEENIKIKKISGKFGSKNFIIDANVYESPEYKSKTEKKSKKKSEGVKS
jgi:ribosomal protein S24E